MGIKLCVVTNKPNVAAVGMVEHIFGKNYFDCIIGCIDGIPTKPDPTSTFNALKKVGCKPSEAIFFGDSEVDMRTAKMQVLRLWAVRGALGVLRFFCRASVCHNR